MAQASSGPPLAPPWSERLFEAARVSPLLLAAAISLTVLVVVFGLELAGGNLQEFLLGRAPGTRDEEYRFSAVFTLLIGYLPAAYTYAVRGSRRALDELRPLLQGTPVEVAALQRQAGRFERSHLRWAGLGGAAVFARADDGVVRVAQVHPHRPAAPERRGACAAAEPKSEGPSRVAVPHPGR